MMREKNVRKLMEDFGGQLSAVQGGGAYSGLRRRAGTALL